MRSGTSYLKLEPSGRSGVKVVGHRTRKPDPKTAPGVWVALNLDVPHSIFDAFHAALTIPEGDNTGVVIVAPREFTSELDGGNG